MKLWQTGRSFRDKPRQFCSTIAVEYPTYWLLTSSKAFSPQPVRSIPTLLQCDEGERPRAAVKRKVDWLVLCYPFDQSFRPTYGFAGLPQYHQTFTSLRVIDMAATILVSSQ